MRKEEWVINFNFNKLIFKCITIKIYTMDIQRKFVWASKKKVNKIIIVDRVNKIIIIVFSILYTHIFP